MASIRSLIASSSRLSAPRGCSRAFTTSPRSLQPEQTSTSSSNSASDPSSSSSSVPPPPTQGSTLKPPTFASILSSLQRETPLIPLTDLTSAAGPSAHTPERAQAIRGYALDALPPNVDPMLDLFTNLLMKHGKKAEAQRRVANILAMIQQTANAPALPLLHQAITLSSPYLRVMSTRRRAKVVLTPMALDERQRTRQGIQWLLKAAEKGRKGGIPREQRIAKEVFAVLEGGSDVYKWIEERHKVATANRTEV